jgi:hypothetical protein
MSASLYFFAHDVFGFTKKTITLDSLTVAGMICLMWCVEEARRDK